MKSYTLITGLLLTAVTACTESVAPDSRLMGESLSPDLSVALPELKQLVELTPALFEEPGQTGAQFTPEGRAYLFENDGEIPQEYLDAMSRGLITRSELDIGFMTDVNVAYAQYIAESRGSSYRTHLVLRVKHGGTLVGTNEDVEAESCLCAHLAFPWGKITSVTVPLERNCGHLAEATGTHQAVLGFVTPSLELLQLGQDTETTNGFERQAECSNNSSGSPGGPGVGEDEQWYLCFWEDYYDHNGEFIRRQELGCQEINTE